MIDARNGTAPEMRIYHALKLASGFVPVGRKSKAEDPRAPIVIGETLGKFQNISISLEMNSNSLSRRGS